MLWAFLACQMSSKPNVVVVVVDTLRADRVGIYGAPRPTTPNIDSFAQQGVFFERAYAHSGWTLPSMTSLWTGLYPHEHRVVRSPTSQQEFGSLPPERQTLAELFKQRGYSTAAVTNNTFLAPDFGLHQGFDDYFYQGADNADIRSAKESTDVALQWWRETQGAKFLVVHYMEPHMDLDPPALTRGRFLPKSETTISVPFRSREAFDITKEVKKDTAKIEQILALYDEEILAIDVQVARLTAALGVEQTMYVLTSDHGEEFWDHGGFEHGHHLMGELTRIPLVFWGAGISKSPKVTQVVSHVDAFQSIVAYANLSRPLDSHGVNLLQGNVPEDQYVISENTLYGDPMLSIVNKDHRLQINQGSNIASLWRLDSRGMETEIVKENPQDLSLPLYNNIQRIRGSTELVQQIAGPHIPSQEAFQQLKLLGYMEE